MGFFNRLFHRTPAEGKDAKPAEDTAAKAPDAREDLTKEAARLRPVAPNNGGTPTPMMVTPRPGTPTPAPAPVVAVVPKPADRPPEKTADKVADLPAPVVKKSTGSSSNAHSAARPAAAARAPAPAPAPASKPAPSDKQASPTAPAARPVSNQPAPAPEKPAPEPAATRPAPRLTPLSVPVTRPAEKPADRSGEKPAVAAPAASAPAPAQPARKLTPVQAAPLSFADDSVSDLLDSILDKVDQLDKAPVNDTRQAPREGTSTAADLSAVRSTFEVLAGDHLFQVRGMLAEARIDRATSAWIAPALSEIRSLRRMADAVEWPELIQALDAVDYALEEAKRAGAALLEGPPNELLLLAGTQLRRALPAAFAGDDDEGSNDRRQAVIVQALLQQNASVDDWTIERLFAAGLNRLERLLLGRADEIAAAAGVSLSVAADIAAGVAAYKQQGGTLAAPDKGAELARLAATLNELTEVQQAFERASNGWTEQDRVAKRSLRRQRETVYARVRLALARLGEMERLAQMEKLTFQRKIEQLEPFVEQARMAVPPKGAAGSAGGRIRCRR